MGLGRAREKTSYQALICRPRAIFNGRACSQANRCEELGEILSKEMLTNKLSECRLIQSSGILSIYLFRRHDIIYSFSLSLIIFFHATLRFMVGLQLARIKKHTSLETNGTVLLFYPGKICSLFFFLFRILR